VEGVSKGDFPGTAPLDTHLHFVSALLGMLDPKGSNLGYFYVL
jgi:hypothetical protein